MLEIQKGTKMGNLSVQVLLSLYRPDEGFLREQLRSIERQTYSGIELLVYNDCPDCPIDERLFSDCLRRVPYRFLPEKGVNLGYNKAFQLLIESSEADALFFCDQDDVWLPEKVEVCIDRFLRDSSLAVVSDRSVVDGDGRVTCQSVRSVSKEPSETWSTGDDIAKYALYTTYALGMSMAVRGDFARAAMPVSDYTGHDKWLIACAAEEGIVSYCDTPLVQYRRHGNNVSGVLKGIETKADYYRLRPDWQFHMVEDYLDRYPHFEARDEVLSFSTARIKRDPKGLFKYRYLAPDIAWFEIVLCFIPGFLFKAMVGVARAMKNGAQNAE